MNIDDLLKERDELKITISNIVESNQRADWKRDQVSTVLLRKRLDQLNWQIFEYENPDAYKLEMTSRARKIAAIHRQRKIYMDKLPKLEDALQQIRDRFGKKNEQNTR